MLVSDYDTFVRQTDQYAERSPEDRQTIAIFGLVGEIGSLISAVKKQTLGELRFDQSTAEIREEIGDIMWYCFSLAQVHNARPINIFTLDIANLKHDMSSTDEAARKIQATLDRSKREQFLAAVERFPSTDSMIFRDYQELAFLTARTEGATLMRVCLALLGQLAAELMRHYLPTSEREINRTVKDRSINQILGEIAWHTSAMASLMQLELDAIAEENQRKVAFRSNRSVRTPLHDDSFPPDEQFPRTFEVSFVTVAPGRSRMYWCGRQLGNELTDNSHDADGYRFHDVMHLAHVAKLGWSPVLRKLMERKRRSRPTIDEVEDGARATIVEELIVKAIHAEGERIARAHQPNATDADLWLFEHRQDVTFRFLRTLRNYVDGLEVAANRYWEWEAAILEGCAIYQDLKGQGQGTVTVDLGTGALTYRPEIDLDLELVGITVGLGLAAAPTGARDADKVTALQRASLAAVGLEDQPALRAEIEVDLSLAGRERPRLRARGNAAAALWAKRGIVLRADTVDSPSAWACSVIAVGDIQ